MDDDSQTKTFYAGNFRRPIDEKNRLTIPSRWRPPDATEFILLPEPKGQFLLVMSPEAFARMNLEVENHPKLDGPERRIFLRHVHARAEHGVADKQGRLVLPDGMCKELGLKGEVVLIGGRGRFEIWNLAKWKRAHEVESPTYQHVANVIGL
ncbi:MAG: hypothetical protein M3Y86_09510 [Verrucomicrobiota bacterium]|nr:hypothetical protein [Verrucomicrobiota bacterium]